MNDHPGEEDDVPGDPHEEIARLEAQIETLAENLERGRKLAVFSKILLAGGAMWLVATIFGIAGPYSPGGAVGAIATILGGFILGGSNRSTMLQTQGQIDAAETRRNALIGAIDLRTVETSVGTRLH